MSDTNDQTLALPPRPAKPRRFGITGAGLPIGELAHPLADYHGLLDLAKLGIGSAYITPGLEEKVALYRRDAIAVCGGGTLFEKFRHQGKLDAYLDFAEHHGFTLERP